MDFLGPPLLILFQNFKEHYLSNLGSSKFRYVENCGGYDFRFLIY